MAGGIINTIVLDSDEVRIPPWVADLDTFRDWVRSEEFPQSGRICFLNGQVWVDMSKEQVFSHNQVKGEFGCVLTSLVKVERRGRFFPDGIYFSHPGADLSSQPDGAFVSTESLTSGRVKIIEGAREGFVELEGTLDMVLEVVGTGSVTKDTVILRELYWSAGIPEYWLVDARGKEPEFLILRRTARGYTATRKQAGWMKSAVLGHFFRVSVELDQLGYPVYSLAVR